MAQQLEPIPDGPEFEDSLVSHCRGFGEPDGSRSRRHG